MTDGEETVERTGRCLCGAVRVTAAKAARHVDACHCDMCRRWAGGPEFGVDCGTDVAFEGVEHVATYRSSDWAERAFCARCGSRLYYRTLSDGAFSLSAGLFDDQTGLALTKEIFVEEKPGWYDLAGERERKTGAAFLAQVAARERD